MVKNSIYFREKNLISLFLILYLLGLILASTVFKYTIVVGVSYILLILFLFRRKLIITTSNFVFYMIMISSIIISSVNNVDDIISNLNIIIAVILNIIIYENFARIKLNKNQVYMFIWMLILFSFLYAIFTSDYEKIFFGNRNTVPILLLFVLFLADLYLYKNKITIIVVWAFAIFFTFMSESRAGLLGIVSYFVLRNVKSKKAQIFLFLVSFFLLILLYVFNFSMLFNFSIMGRSISNLAHRDVLWSFALSLIHKYPLGMGYKGYSEIFSDILGVSYSVHNTYLNILLQFGYIFFIVYVIFFFKLVRDTYLNITLACVFSVYLRGFFESGVPFGFSLTSAMLLLPFYLEKGFLSLN